MLPYKDKLFKENFNFTDGEAIYSISVHGVVILSLPNERPRNIGFLAKSRDGVMTEYHVTRNPEVHLFRKLNAYGINHKIMEVFDPDNIIVYIRHNKGADIDMRIIDRDTYKQHAQYLHFKKQNFELQRFIGVEHLQKVSSKSVI